MDHESNHDVFSTYKTKYYPVLLFITNNRIFHATFLTRKEFLMREDDDEDDAANYSV